MLLRLTMDVNMRKDSLAAHCIQRYNSVTTALREEIQNAAT